ncbi:MAG: hypothetical protein JO234_06805 [Hyphomicrobiales bacterium]|nr:hypothetical protein [Hyphomicrobiales bacterium]
MTHIVFAAALVAALSAGLPANGAPARWNSYAPIGTVNPDGSVVLATGPGTFARFVQGKSQCRDDETDMPTWSDSGVYLGRSCQFHPSGN